MSPPPPVSFLTQSPFFHHFTSPPYFSSWFPFSLRWQAGGGSALVHPVSTSAIFLPQVNTNAHNRQNFQISMNYSRPHIYNTSPDPETSAFIFNPDKPPPHEIWMFSSCCSARRGFLTEVALMEKQVPLHAARKEDKRKSFYFKKGRKADRAGTAWFWWTQNCTRLTHLLLWP